MNVDYDQICTFRLAGHDMAVPVLIVREVLRSHDVTPLPRTPESVAGLVSLRGQIAMAIDLRARFGFDAETYVSNASNVVIERDDSLYTLLVDEIGDIVDVDPERLGPVPKTFDSAERELGEAVLERDSGWTLILDIERILDIEL